MQGIVIIFSIQHILLLTPRCSMAHFPMKVKLLMFGEGFEYFINFNLNLSQDLSKERRDRKFIPNYE